jgi:PIN domain nuclease of toxin-antitoxin system
VKYLLDTHALLFSAFGSPGLSAKARRVIVDAENEVAVSVVSFWEISLKYALGKLDLVGVTPPQLPAVCREMGVAITPLSPLDASTFHTLPRTGHKDPFDRIIIWQAIRNQMILISRDRGFAQYREQGLRTLW